MRRIALILSLLVLTPVALMAASAGADDKLTYQVELDNAFGLVDGSEVRVAGVQAGTIKELDINAAKRALVTIEIGSEFGPFNNDASCSSEPQSLIAEYFLDCQPGQLEEELPQPEGSDYPTIPVGQTTGTVQNDLVQNTLREPFKRRFQLILNEFGTALTGNGENLNAAIRRGAPALRNLAQVLKILERQNTVIRDLNANSDEIVARLTERREDVVRFIDEAEDTSRASADRREDLARDFEQLPDFLAELRPTMVELGKVADESAPLLRDLRLSSKQLNLLTRRLPPFNEATRVSLDTLGDAGIVGRRALNKSGDEIAQLELASRNAFPPSDELAKFLTDLDDPRRGVEIDPRVPADTGRTGPLGSSNAQAYTGLESLLNYVYYQSGSLNQFDDFGYNLHFTLNELESTGSPCAEAHYQPNWPAAGGGSTTNPNNVHRCVALLGPNPPQVTQSASLPQYSKDVCDDNTTAPFNVPVNAPAPGRANPICSPTSVYSGGRRNRTSSTKGAQAGFPGAPDGRPEDPISGMLGGLGVPQVQQPLPGLGDVVPGGGAGGRKQANGFLNFLLGP